MNSKTIHYTIYHYKNNDIKSGRFSDLEIIVKKAERIEQDKRLLSVFRNCINVLYEAGLLFEITGEDNE